MLITSKSLATILRTNLKFERVIKNQSLKTMSTKPKVYVTREVNAEALKLLSASCEVTSWTGSSPVPREVLLKNIEDKSGLFCMLTEKIDRELLDAGSKLKVVATMSVGHDHIDLKEIKQRNIRVGYTPDILTDATAELTLAVLLATSRRLFEAAPTVSSGEWSAWSPFWMCGRGLKDSTVGIVGFGRIGQEVAKRIKPFNPKEIIFHNRSLREEEAKQIGASKVSFDQLLERSDFVIITCALTPETTNLFNTNAFNKMKSNAILVNTSRGGVVEQEALYTALKEGKIWGAGLDVMTPEPLPLDSPLLELKNCVLLPHIGSATVQSRNEMGVLTARNVIAGINGEKMPAELTIP